MNHHAAEGGHGPIQGWSGSPLTNRAGSHSTQSHPRLLPQNCWNLLFLYLLKKSSFPLDPFQDKTHSFPWLAVPSWKLSSESRCSKSDTYFLTQAFITASHPTLRHYLLGNSRSPKPHRKAVLVGSITITSNWSKILFYEAFVSSLLWLLQETHRKAVMLFFLSSLYSLWYSYHLKTTTTTTTTKILFFLEGKETFYLEITFFGQSHINCYAFQLDPRMRKKAKFK